MINKIMTFMLFLMLTMSSTILAKSDGDKLPTLQIVTEGLAPVSYRDPLSGKLSGFATKYIKDLVSLANIDYQFNVYPWSRTYRMGTSMPNVLVIAVARTKLREEKFIWFEKIFSLQSYLYGLGNRKDDIRQQDNDYTHSKIGIVRNDFVHEAVIEKGFTNIVAVENQHALAQLLLKERVDFIISSPFALKNFDIGHYLNKVDLYKAHPLNYLHTDIYYAFSLGTDERIIHQMTAAAKTLKAKQKQSLNHDR